MTVDKKIKKVIREEKNLSFNGRKLLKKCFVELKDKKIENWQCKSEYLLREFLNCSRIDLYSKQFRLNKKEIGKLQSSLDRLKENEPVQYITNSAYFLDNNFYVKKGVFIPRPETEILVQEFIRNYNNYGGKLSGIDIGTGCGNISITIVKKLPEVSMEAVDISYENIKVAKFNALRHEVSGRIKFKQGDLFSSVSERKYDFIISNPPYIEEKYFKNLPLEVKYEPELALDGKKDGMGVYNGLIYGAEKYLKEGSKIFLEIGFRQRKLIRNLIKRYSGLEIKKFCLDYNDQPRVVIIEKI